MKNQRSVGNDKVQKEEVSKLLGLYDSFQMAEFMDQSTECSDINIRAMRRLCFYHGRIGKKPFSGFFNQGDVRKLEKLAMAGDPVAQANIAQFYLSGILVEYNFDKVMEWLEKSAAQGYLRGVSNLGRNLVKTGDEKLIKQGAVLLKAAAERGCPGAFCNYGLYLYHNGGFDAAKRWFKKSADAGMWEGFVGLCKPGMCSPDEVRRLVRMAWERGHDLMDVISPGILSYGNIYSKERLSQFGLPRLPMDRLKSLARRDAFALTYLAYLYYDGKLGVQQDYVLAKKMFMRAAKKGIATAQSLLGECYYKGRGCKTDFGKALYWFDQAARQNEAEALGWLANMYYRGDGCKLNIEKSVEFEKRAVRLGNQGAQYNHATRYLKIHRGLPYAPKKAVDLLWPLACRGRHSAIELLGKCYVRGEGVHVDLDRGFGLISVVSRFRDVGYLYDNVSQRGGLGYLQFYEAALSCSEENTVDAGIIRMLEQYEAPPAG